MKSFKLHLEDGDNGRECTGQDVIEWVTDATARGAGEVLITSIDREGTRTGFDVELVRAVSEAVSTPAVASGGMGSIEDLVAVAHSCALSGVTTADVLHFGRLSMKEIRLGARDAGLDVRDCD